MCKNGGICILCDRSICVLWTYFQFSIRLDPNLLPKLPKTSLDTYNHIIIYNFSQLCLLLCSEDIFQTLSEILMVEEDVKFACTMVYTLNKILLTSTELFELRNQLKDLNTKVDNTLFLNIFHFSSKGECFSQFYK